MHDRDNRKAFHDCRVLDMLEAGIALSGTEGKAAGEGAVNLRDSYARVDKERFGLMTCR